VGASGSTTLATPINTTGGVQVASGVTVELHGTLPRIDQDGLISLRTCINRMLRKLWTTYRFPFTAVDAQTSYDLGSLFWASRHRFKRLIDPDPGGSGHPPIASQGWDVVPNGEIWTLELGAAYPAGTTFWLECEIPLNYRLYLAGAWANQASPVAGLTLDADACLGQWEHVFACALYECMQALSVQAGGARKAYWQNEVMKPGGQRDIVSSIKLYQMDEEDSTLGEGPTNSPSGLGFADKGLFSGRRG
jgi:hypothetical protein